MKLDIIVPHYKESWSVCKYLLDTIATQRGISFDNVRVILVNDGNDILLGSADRAIYTLCGYPFTVDYILKEHGGVSAARNEGLNESDADYVMFCDADDGFLNNYALHAIFSAMQEGFDLCISNFIEETFDADGNLQIAPHNEDLTFMHGKVYRRKFLIENSLRFDESMTLHEDGYFNMLVYSAVKQMNGTVKKICTPLYIWRWNDNSVVRKDREDFVLKTYEDVMKTRIGICREQKRRGYDEFYKASVCMTVLNSYYDFQKTRYHMAKNQKYLRKAEKAFREFWLEFKPDFYNLTNQYVAEVAQNARERACKKGMLLEMETLREFLKRIEHEVKE